MVPDKIVPTTENSEGNIPVLSDRKKYVREIYVYSVDTILVYTQHAFADTTCFDLMQPS